MRKALMVITTLVMVLGFATGCRKQTPQESSGKIVVGYIAKNSTDTFHYPINTAAKSILDAYKKEGIISDWHFYDGLTDPVTQVSLMDTALTQGCNFIIFLPAEAAGSAPVLDKAKERNVPVIVVNSTTTNTDALATAYVGSDDVQAGEMMAKFVQSRFPNGGGYGHIQGPIGNSAQLDRGTGMHNILDKDSNWKLLDEQSGEWQGEKAARFAEDWRTKYGAQLNALICDNDDMSSAAQNVMNAAGRKDIVAVGVDGNPGPLSMVKNGELQATIYQDGVGQVTKALDLLKQLIQGQSIPKRTMVDFVLITKDNVDRYQK
ncbi:substrate-binding domain-containing protein [Treponema primitia]|uniref:substrate-binding domain-containing protein n=1 Tax=Treponema primitia TaxID=88058 RepID=UPI00397FE52B